jgi:hypothetical protein
MAISPSLAEMEASGSTVTGSVAMETELRCSQVRFVNPMVRSPAMMSSSPREDDGSMDATMRSLVRSLVLKCISAACHVMAPDPRRDSLENLISSTKRMRISSPSPSNEDSPLLNTVSSPLAERSVTPESMRMQKLRKKRGRSESHEVNSLTDYNMITRHFRNMVTAEKKGAGLGGRDEGDNNSMTLGSLVEHLGMMTIDEDKSDTDSEEVVSPTATAPTSSTYEFTAPPTASPTTHQDVPSSAPSLSSSAMPSPFAVLSNDTPSPFATLSNATPSPFAVPPNLTTPSLLMALPNTTPPHMADLRRTANIGSVPDMDLYAIIHSCPPRGVCQKFLCSNCNEVNLVYHCWLFGEAPFDPNVTLSDQLAVGVFDYSGVQPVHLELQDAGVPFDYLEDR